MKVVVSVAVLVWGAGVVQAQSLAQLARQEAARRAAVEEPAPVYTNADLRSTRTLTSARVSAAESAPADAAPAGADDASTQATTAGEPARETEQEPAPAGGSDERVWRDRMAEARARVARSRLFAEALQSRINALTADFTARDDPAQRTVLEQDRIEALSELERVQAEIEEQEQAIRDLEEEARRAGVPAGWLR